MKKIHHDIEFTRLRKHLDQAGSIEERISLLQKLVALNPRNPTNLTLRRKYRDEMETLRLKKGMKRRSAASPYEGINHKRQVVLVGETNTGKSMLLNRLTVAKALVRESTFTTYHPEAHVMNYKDVPIQVIEVPAIYEGDSDAAKYRFIRNSDVVCVCTRTGEDFNTTIRQLNTHLVKLASHPAAGGTHKYRANDEKIEKPGFAACWNMEDAHGILDGVRISDIASISGKIYSLLNIKRIFCIRDGRIQEKPPVFPAGQEVTISEFIMAIDKRILAGFKRAKVTHADANLPAVHAAGLDYLLADGDIVEIVSS